MGTTEIELLVLGSIIFILSFVIPAKKEKVSKETLQDAKEEIKKIVDEAVKEANSNIEDNVKEISDYNVEKAERAMERLCNEKIMAINEYSSTVLESIDKNHQEVMFMYDMLNDKHNTIKETAATVDKTVKEVKQTAQDVAVAAGVLLQVLLVVLLGGEEVLKGQQLYGEGRAHLLGLPVEGGLKGRDR